MNEPVYNFIKDNLIVTREQVYERFSDFSHERIDDILYVLCRLNDVRLLSLHYDYFITAGNYEAANFDTPVEQGGAESVNSGR